MSTNEPKRDPIEWADDVETQFTVDSGDVSFPATEHEDGYKFEEPLPHEQFNGILRNIGRWAKYTTHIRGEPTKAVSELEKGLSFEIKDYLAKQGSYDSIIHNSSNSTEVNNITTSTMPLQETGGKYVWAIDSQVAYGITFDLSSVAIDIDYSSEFNSAHKYQSDGRRFIIAGEFANGDFGIKIWDITSTGSFTTPDDTHVIAGSSPYAGELAIDLATCSGKVTVTYEKLSNVSNQNITTYDMVAGSAAWDKSHLSSTNGLDITAVEIVYDRLVYVCYEGDSEIKELAMSDGSLQVTVSTTYGPQDLIFYHPLELMIVPTVDSGNNDLYLERFERDRVNNFQQLDTGKIDGGFASTSVNIQTDGLNIYALDSNNSRWVLGSMEDFSNSFRAGFYNESDLDVVHFTRVYTNTSGGDIVSRGSAIHNISLYWSAWQDVDQFNSTQYSLVR